MTKNCLNQQYRGFLAVFGGFLIQLTAGAYHGTFGNLLPYFSSYVKKEDPEVTHGDLAMVFASGGIAQGISCMMGGLILVPVLGKRGCLIFGCLMFTIAPFLTYLCLDTSIPTLSLTYGILSASAANMITLPTMLIPVTWFPQHKGKVIGMITSGYGFSSTIFIPLQTLLINPANIPPLQQGNSSSVYFTEEQVLKNFPPAFLYLGIIYIALFTVGILLTVEKDSQDDEAPALMDRLRESFSYLIKHAFKCLDFYLLWLTRFLFLAVGCGVLAHWKTFTFTHSENDKLVSLAGGVNGIMNCLSRGVAGALLDRIRFNRLMPVIAAFLTILLLSIFFIAQFSLPGLIVSIWTVYALSFSHFSTVPAQALNLFKSTHNSVVVGTIGLADTFSYLALGFINRFIMSKEDDHNMFLWFFIILASFSFLGVIVTRRVSSNDNEVDKVEKNEDR